MKYLWALLVVIALVRIDVIIRTVEKLSGRFRSTPQEVLPEDIRDDQEMIPFDQDKTLKQSSRGVFFSLLKNFHTTPSSEIRKRAVKELKANPRLFTKSLDKEFEGIIYSWRDLIQQKNKETLFFLTDLLDLLQGENREMVKRFFSLLMDHDIKEFLDVYPRAKDPSCSISTVIGDALPQEEKYNEYAERMESLTTYLSQEKVPPEIISYGNLCLTGLKIEAEKIAPKIEQLPPNEDETEETQP